MLYDEVVAIFNEENTQLGVNVFIDARADTAFEEGHIPGAVQCDHYQLEDYMEAVLDVVYDAEKIIVYCNGGECEDSIFVCADLIDFDVSYDSIYLFAGGWKEWSGNGMPIAKGREDE